MMGNTNSLAAEFDSPLSPDITSVLDKWCEYGTWSLIAVDFFDPMVETYNFEKIGKPIRTHLKYRHHVLQLWLMRIEVSLWPRVTVSSFGFSDIGHLRRLVNLTRRDTDSDISTKLRRKQEPIYSIGQTEDIWRSSVNTRRSRLQSTESHFCIVGKTFDANEWDRCNQYFNPRVWRCTIVSVQTKKSNGSASVYKLHEDCQGSTIHYMQQMELK